MMIKVTRPIICSDSLVCSNNMIDKLKTAFPNIKLRADTLTQKVNGHLSIRHEQNNHTIWVFVYDKDGIHESNLHGTNKIIKTKSNRVLKPVVMPSKIEVENLI